MSQKKATIVNLAASNVSVSQFTADSGSLVLEQFYVEEITPGLTGDDEWLNAAIAALAGLVSAHQLRGRVTVIAPAFLLLQKPLKVPQVERQRQAQIVAFEAQNAIPYPLNEVIWDSQVMSSDGVEAEVLLFALRTEIATRIATLVSGTGLRPSSIQAAPLLDSQAFRLAGGSATEEVLIINVGARSTTLSFVGPGGVNIQTATNIGGNLLTQGVSDNTGQPFATAEAIKVGYFSGVIHLAEADPQVAILQANSQTFIRRLAQDINRRLINVRRGTNGRQPARILVTGRGSQVPGLSEQLCETLRLPVEPFDPSSVLTLGAEINTEHVQRARYQISEVIGEAARLILPQTAGVNLVPRDIASQMAFDVRKPGLIAAALLAALAPWPVWMAFDAADAQNHEKVATLTAKKKELAQYRIALIDSHKKALELQGIARELESVVLNRSNWPAFLGDLQGRVGNCKNTWIEELHVRYEALPTPPPVDGQPAPATPPTPVFQAKVTVTARFLLPEVHLVGPQFAPAPLKASVLQRQQKQLLDEVRKSPYVASIPEDEIKPILTSPNTPKITFTLIIRSDKAL
jgi:type IV pilus assembly protein PilM